MQKIELLESTVKVSHEVEVKVIGNKIVSLSINPQPVIVVKYIYIESWGENNEKALL